MKTQQRAHRRSRRGPAIVVVGASAIALILSGCSGGGSTAVTAENQGAVPDDVLPSYIPVDLVEPDLPGVNGSLPGFLTTPDPLVAAFDEAPGSGGSYTAMTPLWGTIPPTEGNQYFDAVSEAMGTEITFQISDGNTYGDKLAAVLASPRDLADWVTIPTWNNPPRFGQAVETVFQDLGPYLSGDNIKKYPYLANIPTESWKACAWNGKIYGLPQPQDIGAGNWAVYRSDLVDDSDLPTNADELIDFVVENTRDGHWGTNDLATTAAMMFSVPTMWSVGEDDKLVHRIETPEYRASLEWMAELYESGAVHPDAVADNGGDSGQRFESGQVMVNSTGMGYWAEALTRNRATDPDFDIDALPFFAADGGEPVIWKAPGASICSYLKKTDDDAQIEELLSAANFMAAPFGTEEFQLVNYGVEGLHYELGEDGVPVATALAQTEVQPTYVFLVAPPVVNAKVSLPDYVERYGAWTARNAEFVQEPLFYGQNITEPANLASFANPFTDLEKDIARGRKSMADYESELETWRQQGGDRLREFYQEIYDAQKAGS